MKVRLKSVSIDQGQRKVRSSLCCNRSSCKFWWDVVSDHWSNGNFSRDLRRVFRVKELPVYLREALLSRKNQIPWHALLPLLLSAPRRWLLPTSPEFLRILRFPNRQSSSLSCWRHPSLLQNQPQTLFPPAFLWMRPAKPTHRRRQNAALSVSLSLIDLLGKFPRVSAGASLLSYGLFLRSVLKFHGVKTALMITFDLIFSERRSFVVSDACLTQRSSCESYSSNWSRNFWAVPRNRYRFSRLSVLRYTTQLSCTFHNNDCTFVTTLLRPFVGLFLNLLSSAEMSALRRIYILVSEKKNWHSRGCQ